jgi:DNA-binding NarL/FixJ family response regulator
VALESWIALLLVSDDAYLVGGLKAALTEDDGFEVRTGSWKELEKEGSGVGVDLVVVDAGCESVEEDDLLAEIPTLALVDDIEEGHRFLLRGAAGVIKRHGDPSRLRAAVVAVHAGLRVVDQRYEELLDPSGTTTTRTPIAELTPRESGVLELMARGLSNPQIASELGVTRHTAKFHVNIILDKLGAQSRTEAVVLAVRSGMLEL